MIYIILFYEFFKIGLFSFGGGLAMLPLMKNIVLKYHWISESDFLNIISISQITPGPVAVNTATFIGEQVGGVVGGVIATLATTLPSFIVMLIVAKLFDKLKDNYYKNAFFSGVKPVTLALITYAGFIILKSILNVENLSQNLKLLIIFLVVFLGMRFFKFINTISFLIVSFFLGVVML